MSSIGIMGGTFNPIHIGHIQIASAAFEQYSLDEVWFMPNHIPGYKSNDDLISGEHRLKMTELAVADIPEFKVSDYELMQSGHTYTARTLEGLSEIHNDACFYFIMGADSLGYFDKWKEPRTILKYARILVAPRDDNDMEALKVQIAHANSLFGGEFFYPIICPLISCSSHEIRDSFKNKKNIDISNINKYLPQSVINYIKSNNLYI